MQQSVSKAILWPVQAAGQADVIKRLVMVIKGEKKRAQIQESWGSRHRETYLDNYL